MSIATKLAKLKTIKQDIKSALEEKGQTPSNVFSTYANNIRAIETGGITPSGELAITENGTYDVTNYASANVNVAGSGGSDLDEFLANNVTELTSNATKVKDYAFYYSTNLTSVNLPKATSIGQNAFYYLSSIKNVNAPKATNIGQSAFFGCGSLTDVYLPNVKSIPNRIFASCNKMNNIDIHSATSVGQQSFYACNVLLNIYLPNIKYIYSQAFYSCYKLKEILIEQVDSICTLSNTNAFNDCYHILGINSPQYNPNGLKDGYIYVPASLLSQYKVATNWSTYASQIVGHQDYVVGDELVNYSNGTYTTCTWYSDKEMTIEVASVVSNGRYYCKLEA